VTCVPRDSVLDALGHLGITAKFAVQRVVITQTEIEVTQYKTNPKTGHVHYDDGLELETYTIEII
jgi:hypothetical protein